MFTRANNTYESTVYKEFFSGLKFNDALTGKIKKHKQFDFVKLDKVSNLITDGTHKTPKYVENGVPFMSTINLKPFEIDFDFSSYVKHITIEEHNFLIKRCKPEKGDVLISKCGTIGRCQVIRTDLDFSIFVGLALVKPKSELVISDYLEILFNTRIYKSRMELLAPGGTRSTLAIAPLKSLIIPLPKISIQEELVKKFKGLLTTNNEIMRNIYSAQSLQKSLINQVF